MSDFPEFTPGPQPGEGVIDGSDEVAPQQEAVEVPTIELPPELTIEEINTNTLNEYATRGYSESTHELIMTGPKIVGFHPKIMATVASVTASIKTMAGDIINGIDNHWRMARAKDKAARGDYTELDLFTAQKEAIRAASNVAEGYIKTLSQDELEAYSFKVDLEAVEALPINRITVGSLVARFSDDEYANINAAASTAPSVAKALFVLQNRTYVDLGAQSTRIDVEAFMSAGLLGTIQNQDDFDTRVDEILRPGEQTEAYRGS